jgi:molecular chaperone GrpE
MTKKTDEVQQLEERVVNLEDQLKRALADYRNLERRVSEDSLALGDYAKSELIRKILPALDSLDQAVAGASQSDSESGWLKGVLMSLKQLRQSLSDEGLVEIEAEGNFDPNLHEAVDVRQGEDGKILEVLQRGYTLNERIVRPAKVVVGKSQPVEISEEAKEEAETEET